MIKSLSFLVLAIVFLLSSSTELSLANTKESSSIVHDFTLKKFKSEDQDKSDINNYHNSCAKDRKRTIFPYYSIEIIRLIGVLKVNSDYNTLLLSPEGEIESAKISDCLGQESGEIISIEIDSITLVINKAIADNESKTDQYKIAISSYLN